MSNSLPLSVMRNDATQTWINDEVPKNVTDPDAFKAARGFESYFARYLIDQLKGEMNLVGGEGYGGDVYQELYVEALGGQVASTGALGITDMIYRNMMYDKGLEPYTEAASGLKPFEQREKRVSVLGEDAPISEEMIRFDREVQDSASRYGLDMELIYAVMQQESGGNPEAVSHAGAKGLMQLIDSTAAEMGVANSFDPGQNINGGAKYLRQQLDEFGSLESALAAYNAGPGAVKQYEGIPPYAETQDYVQKVTAIYSRLKDYTTQSREAVASSAVPEEALMSDAARRAAQSPTSEEG